MNILFVTKGFPSDDNVMDGNYEAVQAKSIAAKGHHVSVIVVREKSLSCILNWNNITHRIVEGVHVYEGNCPIFHVPIIRRINRYTHIILYRSLFKKNVKEHGIPDIIHGHVVYPSYYALSLKKDYKIPLVITEHWSRICMREIPEWLRRMSIDTYKCADQVICVSHALADSVKKHFDVDSIVINNMVSDIFTKKQVCTRHDGRFRFIACGAFRPDRLKGFDLLVEAFAMANFPKSVSLDIVGDGEERYTIEKKIEENCMTEQIKVLGTKTPEEVSELLSHSDCFVLSSRLETFAIVVIEAMAIGLPVIATKCGGPESFLQSEHGILVDKENVEELAKAMQYMTVHYKEFNPDNIREFCNKHFSQEIISDQIIDVYKHVLIVNEKNRRNI